MNDEDEFTRTVRRDLRRLVQDTSPRMRARLDRMADEAVSGRSRRREPVRRTSWPFGAVAATLVAVTLGLFLTLRQEPAPASPADDVALLLNVDNFELLEQMEFYLWLDRQPGILEGEVRGSS
jgi:hypothetical protein